MPFSCKPSRTAAAQALVAAMVLLLAPSASAVRKCGQNDIDLAAGAESIPSDCTGLGLAFNNIGDTGAAAIAEALKTNTAVTSLGLDYNRIGDDGAVAIAEALKTNTAITSLHLHSNSIGDAGAEAIAGALKTNTAVTSLDLRNNNIDDAGAVAIAEALKTNTAVTSLDLRDNNIGVAGAAAVAEALKTNTAVTTLDLGDNYLGDAGAAAIAKALKTNTAVTSLDLRNNNIGDAGAAAIAEALKTNTAVTSLNMHGNSIGAAGAVAIAEALETNTAVTHLELGGNNLGDAGAAAIAEALETNTAVTHLGLYFNNIGAEIFKLTLRSIQMATYKNAKITELEAERASAGLSRYLTITNDDFINLAEVAAFDASGNQLTPVHASMNNEYGHDHGANKCIDGIAGRGHPGWSGGPWYSAHVLHFFGYAGNNMCHSQPSDASGLQWLRLDFGSLVRVASVLVTNRVNRWHGRIDGAQIQLSVAETSGVVWSDTFFGAAPEYTFVHPAAAAAAATGTGRRAREESPDLGVEEEPSAKKPAQSAPSLTIRGRPVSN